MKRKLTDSSGIEPKMPRLENKTVDLELLFSSDELDILRFDVNELNNLEMDQTIETVAANNGLGVNEYVTMTQICVDSMARFDNSIKTFSESAHGSGGANLCKIISDFEIGKIDETQIELAVELNEKTLADAVRMLEEAKQSSNSIQNSYIQSLSPITMYNCGKLLCRYLSFLQYRKVAGQSNCYELAELKKLDGSVLNECLKNLFGEFLEYLQTNHDAQNGLSTSKVSKRLEPSTIMGYGYGLIRVLKVFGIVSPDVARSKLLGSSSIVQLRKTFKLIEESSPILKEAFTPIDAVEFIRSAKITSIAELQHVTMLSLSCETGIRIGTLIARNTKKNGEQGLLLNMLAFEFMSKDRFIVKIKLPHQKQDKAKTNDNSYVLDSSAHYCGINAANLLLLFIATVGYTEFGLVESLQSGNIKIKNEFMTFPIFAKIEQSEIKPGEFMGDDRVFRSWLSDKSGIPHSLMSNRSLRRGNATAIKNSVIANDPTATSVDVQEILIGSGDWASKRNAQLYVDQAHGPLLSNFGIYNLPVEEESRRLLMRSNLSSYFLSPKFLEMKLGQKELKFIKNELEKQREIEISKLEESNAYQTCERIKRENQSLLTKAGQFNKLSDLSKPVRTEYAESKKIYDIAVKKVDNKFISKFKTIVDTIARKRWMKAKSSLKDEELHVPEIQSNIKLDYCSLADQLKNVGVLSSLDGLCGMNFISEIPAEGIQCPICEDLVKTFSGFKKHIQDQHNAGTSLKKAKTLAYSCRVDGCRAGKNVQYNTFCSHNRKAHGWLYRCQTCNSDVSQADSKKHPTNHVLLKPWEFESLKWNVLSTKCVCFNQVGKSDFDDKLICITDDAEVRAKCVNGPSLEAIYKLYKLKYPNSTMRDCSKAFIVAFLKIKDDQLPECIKEMIEILPN
ncbi:hypothetical protein M3Y97_00954400 [Aphelenchoides bicaudatus]|nr:hypothetical protein M3Y97_00954400 [Aphelenchoides bicaudatus]